MWFKNALLDAARFNVEFVINVLFDQSIIALPLWLTSKAMGFNYPTVFVWSFGTSCVLNFMACCFRRPGIKVPLGRNANRGCNP